MYGDTPLLSPKTFFSNQKIHQMLQLNGMAQPGNGEEEGDLSVSLLEIFSTLAMV